MPDAPRSRQATQRVLDLLRRYESRNVTCMDPAHDWPIVWARARDTRVWDADGRAYLDLTAAFGVAAAGHANPRVVAAGRRQMGRLLHAMGDVHPHALKAGLTRELSRWTFERWTADRPSGERWTGKTVLSNSGFEAVESALKTARLATGKPGVIAFQGGYHGLGYGALNVTHRHFFREPFRNQLREFGRWIPFPTTGAEEDPDPTKASTAEAEAAVRRTLASGRIGAILIEPVQGRGGIRVPPWPFLRQLRRLADESGALLIVDEVFTGFGRTGKWFACEWSGVVPDIICLGKALTGGFPLSACVGRSDIMDRAWPESGGEALHTSTFLGHPVGCAMALAQLKELRARRLADRAHALGRWLKPRLADLFKHVPGSPGIDVRGIGLMWGLAVSSSDGSNATQRVIDAVMRLLKRGFIVLPEGEFSDVLSLTPPLTISRDRLEAAIHAIHEELLHPAQNALKPRRRIRAKGAKPSPSSSGGTS